MTDERDNEIKQLRGEINRLKLSLAITQDEVGAQRAEIDTLKRLVGGLLNPPIPLNVGKSRFD